MFSDFPHVFFFSSFKFSVPCERERTFVPNPTAQILFNVQNDQKKCSVCPAWSPACSRDPAAHPAGPERKKKETKLERKQGGKTASCTYVPQELQVLLCCAVGELSLNMSAPWTLIRTNFRPILYSKQTHLA